MRRRGNILSEYYDSLINLKGRTAESYMLTEKLVGIILPKSLYYIRNDILEIILDNDDNILKDNFHFDIPHYIVVSEYTKFNKNLYNLSVLDGLSIMNKLVTLGEDIEMRKLGGIYVLGGLTMVNSHAAMAFPWLYQSFATNIQI